jgi:hypothetical protein
MKFLRCVGYLFFIGIASFLIGLLLPRKWFHADKFPYCTARWEDDGKFYNKIAIRKWKNKMPDMSRVCPFMTAKRIPSCPKSDDLELLVGETCVAELTHVLLILGGIVCIWIWNTGGIVICLLWTIGNIPFVIIQRYNRPALCRLQAKLQQKG